MRWSTGFLAAWVFLLCSGQVEHVATAITLLHEFAAGANDGQIPRAALALSGSTLFGTTWLGGNGRGTVFSVKTDGGGFNLLHEFAGGANDGDTPLAGLTLSGSTLFGTTRLGGNNDAGTVFSVNTDGSDFKLLHEFAGGGNDGREPRAGLTLSGSTLFGTTRYGGNTNDGTIFSMNTDGSGFTLLHDFAGGANDGLGPVAGLTVSGSTLFGTTLRGGDNDRGTIFSINTNGSGFILLHEFAGEPNDGRLPIASLNQSGSTLFGTTSQGGDHDLGTIFSMSTDGSGFTLLHDFAGGANDGSFPEAGLTLSGSILFGTTGLGGDAGICVLGCGTIFSVNTDGSGYRLLHEFAGGTDDGSEPSAGLALSGSTLFGTTERGGYKDWGTVFSIVIPEPDGIVLVIAGFACWASIVKGKGVFVLIKDRFMRHRSMFRTCRSVHRDGKKWRLRSAHMKVCTERAGDGLQATSVRHTEADWAHVWPLDVVGRKASSSEHIDSQTGWPESAPCGRVLSASSEPQAPYVRESNSLYGRRAHKSS